MPSDARDALEVLRFELTFIEQGGYGRHPQLPAKPVTLFQDSLTCLNFGTHDPVYPCRDCILFDFVPEKSRNEILPCHYIPLNVSGDSIASLDRGYNQHAIERAVVAWLRATVRQLERERAALVQTA